MQRMLTLSRTLASTAALLVVAAATASAGGINLAWNDCSPAGQLSKTFACNSNTLTGAIMIASAVAPVPMDQLNSEESEMILQTNQAALSPWWNLQTGGCRTGMAGGFDFTGGPFTCIDPWVGAASGGMNYVAGYGSPNAAQIRTVCAIAGSTGITGTDEYYFFKITLLGAKTTGTGSCAGCTDGACIVFTSLKLNQPAGVGDYVITNPLVNQYVTWQTGGAGVGGGCPAVVPTRSTTWGSVKSLYR
jgi:hypothetical protein